MQTSESNSLSPSPAPALPYAGLRVVEFTHMVMGPTCGMVLADLGAEVIKVETVSQGRQGDATRELLGSGAGFFALFNRNKKSLALDLTSPEGQEAVLRLIATADIVSENFKAGTMKKLGLDYDSLKALNPRLIYVSHKGFLPGPYEHRTALDEVVQMMGGLCPMTLPDGRETQTVLLPLTMDGQRLGVHRSPPQLGEHNAQLLADLGYSPEQIESLSPR